MKSTLTLRLSIQNKTRSLLLPVLTRAKKTRSLLLPVLTRRLFLLTLVSFVAVAALLGVAASANKANRAAKAREAREAQAAASKSAIIKNSIAPEPHSIQQQPSAPNAAAITATLTDTFPDIDANGKVNPGDTITYLATINNGGANSPADDALTLAYNATLDNNTTLVAGSLHASPIAINDSYTTVGNTLLEVGVVASGNPAVSVAGSLFDNDINPATPPDTKSLQSFQAVSAQLGTVSVNANGTFTYLPAVGFTGTDTFTYTIRNDAVTVPVLTNSATVTITVGAPRVWYVNNAVANGDGRSTSPFDTLANAAAVDAVGDIIYIFTGSGNYTGGITLLNNEQVIGNGVALVVNTFTLRAAGTRPTVVNAAGNGITLASANTLSGFNFGNCTGGFAIQGTNVGTLTVNNMLITTNGGGVDLTGVSTPTVNVVLDSLTSIGGTRNVNLVGLNGTINLGGGALSGSTSGATNHAFAVSGGNATVTYTGSITKGNTGNVVNISSRTGGTVTLSGTIDGTSSNGINASSNTGGTIDFSGGTKTLNTGANAAVTLSTNTGATINFSNGGLNIDTTSGGGINATGGGTVTVSGSVNTIDTTTGTALNVANTTIGASGLTFRSITSNGSTNGIVLNNTGSSGALTVSGNGGSCTVATPTCTGGQIQNTSSDGILLTSTNNVSLNLMNIHNNLGAGIRGTTLNGFTLANDLIAANGDQAAIDEPGVIVTGLTGTAIAGANPTSITNTTIKDNFEFQLQIINSSGTLTDFQMSGNTISSTGASGVIGDLVDFLGSGTSTMKLSVTSGTFTGAAPLTADGIFANSGGTSMTVNVTGATFTTNNAGVNVATNPVSTTLTFNISSNNFQFQRSVPINLFNNGNAPFTRTVNGNILNNTIGTDGVAVSGSSVGNAITIGNEGAVNTNLLISGNQIFQIGVGPGNGQTAINILHGISSPTGGGTTNVTLTGNTIKDVLNGRGLIIAQNDYLVAGGAAGTVCADISGNTFAGTILGQAGDGSRIRLRRIGNATTSAFNVRQADVNALSAANTGVTAAQISVGGAVTFNGGDCADPPPPAAPPADDISSKRMDALKSYPSTNAFANADIAKTSALASVARQVTSLVNNSAVTAAPAGNADKTDARLSHHAPFKRSQSAKASTADKKPLGPQSGELVSVNVGTLPATESVMIIYQATVNTPPLARQATHQGSVTFTNGPGSPVLTDDPSVGGAADPTVTLIDTTTTWDGSTSTDWNDPTNWTPAFVPSSVSDVIIPNAGVTFEPNIITPDVNVFTLDLQSARTLTINPGRTLTVNGGLTTLAGALAGGPYTLNFVDLTINRAAGITVNGPTSVSGVLTLTSGNVTNGANPLTVGSTGSIVRTSGHIVGSLKKTNVTTGFVFTVGTGVGYTQVDITSASGGGDLTVTTVDAPQPTLETNNPGKSLTEYWTLTEGGTLTASLVFHYLQTDVPGTSNEANYRIIRVVGTATASFPQSCPTTSCVDTAANTFTISGVTNFSDWTVGEVLAPTASGGVVTGRIVNNNGMPVEGAVVRLSGTQNRKFITDANGFYRFENVETNGFYIATPSRANYTFSPSSRSFSQIGETTEAAFGATLSSSGFVNPLDTPEYFVRQHYIDFLGREPDEAGFNFWSDQILECGFDQNCIERRRENVSAAYFLSIEFQQTGGLVDGLYRASYGVRPNFAEFMPDTRAVGLGVVVGRDGWQARLEANKQAFVTAFVNRPAFHAAYDGLSSSDYVDALISHAGVSFTSGERDALANGLATGTATRAEVLRSIAENGRFVNAKFNEAFVMMEYFGYLRRNADADGFAFWLNKLNQFGGNFEQAEMVKAFIVSGEYRDRFPR